MAKCNALTESTVKGLKVSVLSSVVVSHLLSLLAYIV